MPVAAPRRGATGLPLPRIVTDCDPTLGSNSSIYYNWRLMDIMRFLLTTWQHRLWKTSEHRDSGYLALYCHWKRKQFYIVCPCHDANTTSQHLLGGSGRRRTGKESLTHWVRLAQLPRLATGQTAVTSRHSHRTFCWYLSLRPLPSSRVSCDAKQLSEN